MRVSLSWIILLGGLVKVHGVTWNEAHDDLILITDLNFGAESLRPLNDLNDTITVNIDLNIASINNFDDANGFMDISGYLEVEWTSQVTFSPAINDYTELVKHTLIWKPPILFVNALKLTEEVGVDSETKIRFNFLTQHCLWRPWVILRGACSPNVKYYPFDRQECVFQFAAWGYLSSEVVFRPTHSEINFNFFEENGAWSVDSTSASSIEINGVSLVVFKIKVSRRPLYHVINLLCPVVFLGVLNVFAFLLPIDSGERVGFSITCFLSYVVLLNTLMTFLPISSLPISFLSYYTFVMMIFSGGMTLATIITVRIHHKPAESRVPYVLQAFIRCLTCCFKAASSIAPAKIVKNRARGEEKTPADSVWDEEYIVVDGGEDKKTSNEEITWKDLSRVIDWFLFLAFLGGQTFYSIAYLVPIFTAS